jgi:uncharacterized SAM-binding protein YcdF (DUF218 family)
MKIKFTTKRTLRVPTIAGWLLIIVVLTIGVRMILPGIYSFLAVNKPVNAKIMVVEGWLSDDALAEAGEIFISHNNSLIISTGGPLEHGFYLAEYNTYARLAEAVLKKAGIDSSAIIALSAPERKVDRTYASALEVRKWIDTSGRKIDSVDLVSQAAHSRRSRMLFQKVLGPGVCVGIISCPDSSYNPEKWWKSSAGFRNVTDELIAWLYARFIFPYK